MSLSVPVPRIRDVSLGLSPLYRATLLNSGSFSEVLSDFWVRGWWTTSWHLLMLCGMKLAIDSLAMKHRPALFSIGGAISY
jgi:hypothetical protein